VHDRLSSTLDFFGPPALHVGLGHGSLVLGAAAVCVLLGIASYMDLFNGRIVNDELTLPMIGIALLAAPLLYEHPWKLAIPVGLTVLIFGTLWLVGAQGGADLKLYVALALIFGGGIFVVVLVSCIVTVCYAIPWAIVEYKRGMPWAEAREKPFVPGIAAAFPLTLLLFGASLSAVEALLGLQALTVFCCWLRYRGWDKAERRWGRGPQRCRVTSFHREDSSLYWCIGEDGHTDGHELVRSP
jgi:Flp pilus assembly protein protease CpaA